MAIIVANTINLEVGSRVERGAHMKRMPKQLLSLLFGHSKHNRSPFPDRVWDRHSALLNASKNCRHSK